YVPRASLMTERTGAEFSPAYHLIMAKESEDPLAAKQCAINALMASPREPKLYGAAALFTMHAQDPELGSELINEGLFLWPKDDLLNLLAAFFSYSSGEYDAAKKFLAVVREGGDAKLLEYASALEKEISRQPVRLASTAFSLQEQSWLALLRPSRMPNASEVTSYPAELRVQFPQFTPMTFEGTLSLMGKITDEQILTALKSAVSAVSEYKSLDDAAADKSRVDALTKGLKFSKEDQDRIIHNWLSLIGWDKQYDLIRGKIPSFDSYDAASELMGQIASLPEQFGFDIPGDNTSMIISGLVVSIKEYQRDQQKYKDIVELSQTKARLRSFYDRVNDLLRNETSKNMHWTIRILQQKKQEETFDYAYEIKAPYLYTADIDLVKTDGEYSTFTGTYSGYVNLSLTADLSDYDKVFCQKVADKYSESMSNGQIKRTYSAISTTVNRPSESYCNIEGYDFAVTLSMPYGTNRMKFELPLDTTKMEAESRVLIDKTYSFGYSGKDMSETITHTRIEDSLTGTSQLRIHRVETVGGISKSFDDEQEGSISNADLRPYIQMTLVIDTRLNK
ncbi:MAG: hypothetical protein J5546_09235, partial [Lachnospiraceae bacterium]|nr:hypothetical protein [Lachnospiraceae bacterium]